MFGTRYVIFRDLDVKARGGCTSGHSDDVAKIKYYLILATSSECSLPNPLLQPSKRLPKKTGCNRLPTGLLVLGQKARTETVGSRISKNRQPKSGCNRCRSGPVAVFLASPQPDFKTLSEMSQASLTVRQASEVRAEPTGREFLAAMTAFFSQMQAKQDEMNKFLVNKQEDMMDVLRHDVAKPLARLAKRENSHSRSSSRASMASRGRVRNDDYTPLRCCMPPRFESKGKETVYSRTREYDDAQLDEEQQHDSVSPVMQDKSVLDAIDAKLAAMAGHQELEVLVALKRNEILRGITKGLLNFERFRRDRDESDSRYNERITKNTKLLLLATLNAGNSVSSLVHDLTLLFKREMRFEPLAHLEQEVEPAEVEPLRAVAVSDAGSSDNSSASASHQPKWVGAARRFRPSFSISNVGKLPSSTVGPEYAAERSSEKTDSLVRQEIQSAMAGHCDAAGGSSLNGKIPFKIPLPEYKGGDGIDEFISFTKELVNYFALHGYMKPEADQLQLRTLRCILKGKALKWYQHTINYGIREQWSFEEAMIGLKRYFIKDASSRDAALKFDSLQQKNRTVAELRRDLKYLGMQIVTG